jgi:hypothetical protein
MTDDETVRLNKVARMRAILADPVRRAAYLSGERVDLLIEKMLRMWFIEEDGWTPLDEDEDE